MESVCTRKGNDALSMRPPTSIFTEFDYERFHFLFFFDFEIENLRKRYVSSQFETIISESYNSKSMRITPLIGLLIILASCTISQSETTALSCRERLENKTIEGTALIEGEIHKYSGGSNQVCGDQLYQATYDNCPIYFRARDCHYSHHYHQTPPYESYCSNQTIVNGRCFIKVHDVDIGDTIHFIGTLRTTGLNAECWANMPGCEKVLELITQTGEIHEDLPVIRKVS